MRDTLACVLIAHCIESKDQNRSTMHSERRAGGAEKVRGELRFQLEQDLTAAFSRAP